MGSDGKPRAMNKFDAVVFDMDGTILDTVNDLADAMNHALEAVGCPKRPVSDARRFLGNGYERLMRLVLPEGTEEAVVQKSLAAFREYYLVHCKDTTKPFPGIRELLAALKSRGVKTAVVSNKIDGACRELASKHFPGLLDAAVGERPGVRKKPAPDTVETVLSELGVPEERAVYVGDTEVDVETAQNAGIPSIIVTWGFRDRPYLETLGADAMADTPEELAEDLGIAECLGTGE